MAVTALSWTWFCRERERTHHIPEFGKLCLKTRLNLGKPLGLLSFDSKVERLKHGAKRIFGQQVNRPDVLQPRSNRRSATRRALQNFAIARII